MLMPLCQPSPALCPNLWGCWKQGTKEHWKSQALSPLSLSLLLKIQPWETEIRSGSPAGVQRRAVSIVTFLSQKQVMCRTRREIWFSWPLKVNLPNLCLLEQYMKQSIAIFWEPHFSEFCSTILQSIICTCWWKQHTKMHCIREHCFANMCILIKVAYFLRNVHIRRDLY